MANDYHNIHALPNGYRLHWYEIDGILGQGGFGITYLAHDVNLNQRVAIKEYLPVDVAGRVESNEIQPVAAGDQADTYQWGLKRFIKEAQTLARFKHPNIVAVNAVFEENNTAYMVMEYVEGEVFEDALREGRTMSEEYLLTIMFAIMAGVEEIHEAGFIHRDIKPDNIYLRRDGTPVLLDFGSARQAFGARSETLTALVSPGYAPYEQYDTNAADKQGPWTDIYALGATFYRAVTGRGPKDAMSRVHGILEGKERFKKSARLAAGKYSETLLNAIDLALEFKPADRPQTIQAWREVLPSPPGYESPDTKDDSGMDLLLISDDEEEETVVLSAPLIPESSAEKGDDEDDEEETVVLDAPLVDAPTAPVDEVIASSPSTQEVSGILSAAVSSEEPDPPEKKMPPAAPSSPNLDSDEETIILGEPIQPQSSAPVQADAENRSERLSDLDTFRDDEKPTEELTADVAPDGQGPSERLPFETIRIQLAKQVGEETENKSAPAEAPSVVTKRSSRGLYRQVGIAVLVIVVIAAMWLFLNPQRDRAGFKVLTQDERAAIKAEREKKKQQEQTSEQPTDEDVSEASDVPAQTDNITQEQTDKNVEEEAQAERLAAERVAAQKAEEEALRKAEEQAQTEQQIKALVSGFDADLDALRLTSPAGDNALSKLQSLLELDPTNPLLEQGFEAIVNRYVGLSKKASSTGQFSKAQGYLDKAATVSADSPALATAQAALEALREEVEAREAAEALALKERQAKEEARLEAEKREAEALAKAEAAEIAKSNLCAARLLEPRPQAFPMVVSSVYLQPTFLDSPAPKIKSAQYRSSTLINGKATEESISHYEIMDTDGVATRVKKNHDLLFDNGAGTARFEEHLVGEHVQILGGLISPVDVINADRKTSITENGLTNTTSTKKSTTTTLTRIYDVSGGLFPLKVGNSFSYRSDVKVEGKDGQVRSVAHKGKPYFYRVSKMVPGKGVSEKLECEVYVVDYVFDKPNYHNAGQLYYSEEIGLIARQIGVSVSKLQDGRSISRQYDRILIDFEL